jgi:hypothetical protein
VQPFISQADLLPVVEQRLKDFDIPFVKAMVEEGGVRVTQVRGIFRLYVSPGFWAGLVPQAVRRLALPVPCNVLGVRARGVLLHGVCRQVAAAAQGACTLWSVWPGDPSSCV